MNELMILIKLVAVATLYTPWKFLRALLQFVLATMLGSIKQNNLIPKYEKDTLSVPSIEYTSTNDFFNGVIAISPLLFMAFFYYYSQVYGTIAIYTLRNYLFVAFDTQLFSHLEIWKIFLGYCFFLAGIPTLDEIKKFSFGLVTPGGFIFLTICFIIAAVIYKNGGF